MRTYRLLSKPHGATRLAIGYLIGQMPELEKAISLALPDHIVVATDDGSPSWDRKSDWEAVCRMADLPDNAPVGLFGWSAGGQPVRQALMGRNLDPNLAWVAVFDGTHSRFPESDPAHIECWAHQMQRAAVGEIKAIFTCTSMTYVERLSPPAGPFMATSHVLERALSASSGSPVALTAGVPFERGSLYVERYASADIDGPAHIRQVREALPFLLAKRITASQRPEELAEAWIRGVASAIDSSGEWLRKMVLSPPGVGQRCVDWCRAEMAAGVREVPPGSKGGPRIDQYFSVPDYERGGASLHLSHVNWCAAAQSMCHHENGVDIPAFVSGVEFESWAKTAGHLADVPKVGDLAIFHRSGEGWERHVTRVTAVHDDGSFETIGGNEGPEGWKEDLHTAKDPALSAFVRVT